MAMSRLWPTAVLSLTILALTDASPRAGEIEGAVSEDAFLLVKVADWPKTLKDLDATALGKIGAEQAIKDCTAAPLATWGKLAALLEKKGGVKREDLKKAYGGELAVFMPGLEKHGQGGQFDPPAFALAFAAKVTDAEAAGRVGPALEALLKKSVEEQGKTCRAVQLGAIKALCTGPEEEDPDNPSVFLFRAGSYQALVLSNSEAKVKALAENLAAGQCAKPLSAAADFKQCRAALGERADFFWYVGAKKLVDQVLKCIPEGEKALIAAAVEALKLTDLPAAAGAVAVEAPGLRSRTFVACKPGPEGLPSLIDSEPLAPEFLKVAPAGTVMMLAGRFKFDGIIPVFRKVGEAIGENFDEAMINELVDELGFDVEKEALAKLGSQVSLLVLPAKAVGGNPLLGELNGMVAVVEVKDAATLRATVAKLAKTIKDKAEEDAEDEDPKPAPPAGKKGEEAKGPVAEFDYKGVKVTSFNAGKMATPAVAVTDKLLLVSPNVGAIKKLLSGLGAGADAAPALVDSEDFKKAMAAAKIDPAKACGVSYVNTGELAAGLLPKLSLASGLLTTFGGGRRARSASKNNLRQIGIACHLWADENDEAFPPALPDLTKDNLYIDNKKVLLCPDYGKHAADGVDYAYVSGLKSTDAGETILAYETLAGPDGTVNVMHIDSSVTSMKAEALKKELEAQAAKFKEAKRNVKVIEPKGVERAAPGAKEESIESLATELFTQIGKAAATPPVDAVTKNLFPAASTTRKVEGGILIDGFGPLGFVPHLGSVMGSAGLGGVMMPWFLFMGMRGAMPDVDVEVDEVIPEALPPVPAPAPAPAK